MPGQFRTVRLCFYLILFVSIPLVMVLTPGETESGSAGEQPDKG